MIRNAKDSYESRERKVTSVVLSLVVAFGLWWYVVNNVSMEDDITFNNIPVVREGESILNENNLMITEISTESVSMNLSGTREDLNKVDSSNMSVKCFVAEYLSSLSHQPLVSGILHKPSVFMVIVNVSIIHFA